MNLPPSPDLFLVAVITSIAARKNITVTPLVQTPLIAQWLDSLKGVAHCEFTDNSCTVKPVNQEDASSFILLSYETLPYKDLVIFTLLGLGKTVAFKSISQKRIDSYIAVAKRLGFKLESAQFDNNLALTLKDPPSALNESLILEENDVAPLLGLSLGLKQKGSFQIGFPYSNPLRLLAPQFGMEISLKSCIVKESDPIARRLKLMQGKKKQNTSQGQQFTLVLDFSKTLETEDSLQISLPGDEVLGSVMVVAKCLFPKGSFVLSNMPLESWATPVLTFIRKMGSKISVEETHRTSFGSTGTFTIQKCELIGRKMECIPTSNYTIHLPAMVVLAAFAKGQSVFRGLEDLRNDVPDGIDLLESCIRTLGARHGEMPDGIVMEGGRDFDGFDLGGNIPSHIAAAFCIAGLKCLGTTTIDDEALKLRWPDFEKSISELCEFRA